MFPEMNVDPCEVHLSDYRPVGSLQLPHRMIVRQGNERFAELIVDQYLVP
jgi:serine protease Do